MHASLEVAQAARVDLHGSGPVGLDLVRVHVAGNVALDDGHIVAVLQGLDGGDDGRGLSGARTRKQVDDADAVLCIGFAQLVCDTVVLIEDPLGDLDGLLCHDTSKNR